MTALLIPFLVADAVLIWMLRDALKSDEVWLAVRMGRKEDNKAIWWMTMVRLGSLLALSLIGTVAAIVA